MTPKTLLFSIGFILCIQPSLYSQTFLVLHKSGGVQERIQIEDISKITFDFNENIRALPGSIKKLNKIASVIKTSRQFAGISYTLRKSSQVTINVFDLNGKRIKAVRNTADPTGTYTRYWNYTDEKGKKVPDGTYIVHVKIDGVPYSKSLFVVQ